MLKKTTKLKKHYNILVKYMQRIFKMYLQIYNTFNFIFRLFHGRITYYLHSIYYLGLEFIFVFIYLLTITFLKILKMTTMGFILTFTI